MKENTLADRLLTVALMTALAVVIARATVLESPRTEVRPSVAGTLEAHGMGAAAGLTLDLIACIPALLVLAARVAGPEEVNAPSVACGIALLLGAWVAASCCWADDKFSAVVHASHFCAGLCLLWAVSQCVVTPARLRIVAAVAFGLLLLNLAEAIQWRFFDMPQTVKYFDEHKDKILHDFGWQPGDYAAIQFEKKIRSKEMMGFTGSSNSFAAILVLLGGVSAGLAIQLWIDGEKPRAALVAVILPATGWILCYTQSKAAFVTPLLIGIILLVTWRCAAFLRRRPARAYAFVAAIILAGIVGVIGMGIVSHKLPGASLNFRWRYWTAAWPMFKEHPLGGVGWSNFGAHYLHFRLPVAAEEIQDPHNFLIRFALETGIVGAILAAAWIARLWWESTQYPLAEDGPRGESAHLILLLAVLGGLLFGMAVIDRSQDSSFFWFEVFSRLVWFVTLSAGVLIAAMKPDSRSAPWIFYAILASIAAFLIHNLIEFSFFEAGPEMIFALLAGSALGMRRRVAETTPKSAVSWLVGGAIAWTAAVLLVIPIVPAEAAADAGDDAMQSGHFSVAADHYADAAELVDYNADYLYREALAAAYNNPPDVARAKSLLAAAISANPSAVRYLLLRAEIETRQRDAAGTRADYGAALNLDPNEVSIRRDYARALLDLNLPQEAVEQLRLAKEYNDKLPDEEPKRLPDQVIQDELDAAMKADAGAKPPG